MAGSNDQHKSGERIAKVIARAGLASRREAEDWIVAGRVAVNGTVIRSAALNVGAGDRVSVDGEPLPTRERTRLFLYHKPRGLITTHADPQGRPTIFEKLPKNLPRLVSVGRLDFNTEGLLLLTNDGALARVLELPATGWLRRYRVRAHGTVTQERLDALRGGIAISGIRYGAIDATIDRVQGSNLWLTFAIREGKNREVRNVLAHLGLIVTRLIRVSFGPFQLGELREGEVEEVRTRILRDQLGERLIAQAGADFSAPIAARQTIEPSDPPRQSHAPRVTPWSSMAGQSPRDKSKPQKRSKSAPHAWRARDEERPNRKFRRKFHGARDERGSPPQSAEMHTQMLTDRKGRSVPVERYGEPPRRETGRGPPRRGTPKRFGKARHRAPERAHGTPPHHPKGRR